MMTTKQRGWSAAAGVLAGVAAWVLGTQVFGLTYPLLAALACALAAYTVVSVIFREGGARETAMTRLDEPPLAHDLEERTKGDDRPGGALDEGAVGQAFQLRGNCITNGQSLVAGDYLLSNNGRYFACMQYDGNFCVYAGVDPGQFFAGVWSANTAGQAWRAAKLSDSGQLAVYEGEILIWTTPAVLGSGGFYAIMQDDGYLCIYAGAVPATGVQNVGTAAALWSSTYDGPPGDAACDGGISDNGVNIPWRTLILAGLSNIPEAGGALSGIVGFLWAGPSTWDQVRAQVEALVAQALTETEMETLDGLKRGLQTDINDYLAAVAAYKDAPNGTTSGNLVSTFTAARSTFNTAVPQFMLASYALPTLPLMASVATMHLSLLRDGLNYGAAWGLDALDQLAADMTAANQSYCTWVDTIYQAGMPAWQGTGTETFQYDALYNWNITNQYTRFMQLNVLDARAVWPSMDPSNNLSPPTLDREIFSDAYGVADTSNLASLGKLLTHLTIDGDIGLITGITASYDGVAGQRVGPDQTGFTQLPNGWDREISTDNPIVWASVSTASPFSFEAPFLPDKACWIVTSLQFVLKDRTSVVMGNPYLQGAGFGSAGYPGHVLSSVRATCSGETISSVVFGFKYEGV